MKLPRSLFVAACCIAAVSRLGAADAPALDPHLEPLRPFLDKTWKGAFKDSNPDKPSVDVMSWERALNGKAVRVLHSINDGVYGGETIFRWDEQKQEITFYYFTTAGFMAVGSLSFKDGKFVSRETISGSSGGVAEVRGTSELLPDGSFHLKTEHLKEGKWEPGHEITYKPDPAAKVIFK